MSVACDGNTTISLVEFDDLLKAETSIACDSVLREVAEWCRDYLCSPHEALGRPGVVCPWTPPSMAARTFWMCEHPASSASDEYVCPWMMDLMGEFLRREPSNGAGSQFKTFVVVFPKLTVPEHIETIHVSLKPYFLQAGLMLGEFHPSCEKQGLRNRYFRPLRSPYALLVIREMVELDITFLSEDKDFIEAYLNRHGSRGIRLMTRIAQGKMDLTLHDFQLENIRSALSQRI